MKIIFSLVLIMLFSSCSSSKKKPADRLYYRFAEASTIVTESQFSIERPTAMGILGNRPMVAQNSDGALLQLNHNFWLDSPKVLLHNYLATSLNNTPDSNSNTLKSNILNLEKKGSTSILSIAFILIDDTNNILFEKTYRIQQDLSENTMPSFVTSINNSLDEIVHQLAADLK